MVRSELLSLSLYQLLASNRSGVLVVYVPLFLIADRGAGVGVALAFVSMAYVASSLMGPVAGRWSDRSGRRRPFLLAAELGAMPLFLVVAFLPGYVLPGLAYLAAQVVLSLGAPALNAYIGDLTRQAERGEGYGILNATSAVGSIAGYVATAFLVAAFGYGSVFPFVAAVMVGTVLTVLLIVPDRAVPPSRGSRPILEQGPLLTFSFLVSLRALGAGAVGTFFGVLAAELGASSFGIAVIAIAGLVTSALLSVPLGRFIDRAGEIRGIWYGTVLTLAGILVFLSASRWPELVPAQVLRYAGFALLSPGMLAYVANRAPADHRAEDLGVFALVNSTCWSLGPLLGGAAYDLGGNAGLFGFAIGTTVVSLVAIELVYVSRRGARGARAPGATGPPGPKRSPETPAGTV